MNLSNKFQCDMIMRSSSNEPMQSIANPRAQAKNGITID